MQRPRRCTQQLGAGVERLKQRAALQDEPLQLRADAGVAAQLLELFGADAHGFCQHQWIMFRGCLLCQRQGKREPGPSLPIPNFATQDGSRQLAVWGFGKVEARPGIGGAVLRDQVIGNVLDGHHRYFCDGVAGGTQTQRGHKAHLKPTMHHAGTNRNDAGPQADKSLHHLHGGPDVGACRRRQADDAVTAGQQATPREHTKARRP